MLKENEEYLTPEEILDEYPFLMTDYNWSIQTPGVFLSTGILHGKYLKGKRMTLIARSSLFRVFSFYQTSNNEKNAHLNRNKPD